MAQGPTQLNSGQFPRGSPGKFPDREIASGENLNPTCQIFTASALPDLWRVN